MNWITDQTHVPNEEFEKARAAQMAEAAKARTEQNSTTQASSVNQGSEHDGQHDFDPLVGSWKYHLKRRAQRLAGSNEWVNFGGTGLCRHLWDGRAELEEARFESPSGNIEGLVVRLYNPQTHQWSLYWGNSKNGIIDPPQVGEFKDGRGLFYAQDKPEGRTVLVRFDWTKLNTNSPHFEQAYSDDGGTTWEVNWITDQTKVSE